MAIKLQADYNRQPVALSGETGRLRSLFAHRRFPLNLSGKLAGAAVDINGVVDDLLRLRGIDVKVRLSGDNIAAFDSLIDLRLPQTTAFDLAGEFKGSGDSTGLANVAGKFSAKQADLTVDGRIGNLIAVSGIDMNLTISGKDLAQIGAIIGRKLPPTDDFTVQARLTGSDELLSVGQARCRADRADLHLTVNGEIENLLDFSGVNLLAKVWGKDLARAGAVIDEKLPATSEFALQGRLTGAGEALALKEIEGSAKQGGASIALSGEAKDLLTLDGLDLQVKGSGKNLAAIGALIGEKLPSTDDFSVQGRLTGSRKTLSLHHIAGRAARGSLNFALKGDVGNLMAISGLDLHVDGSGANLAQAGKIIGRKLPATDDFTVRGRLTGSAKALSLPRVEGSADRDGLKLTFSGAVKKLLALEGIQLKLNAAGRELAAIGPLVGAKLPDMGPFDVSGVLAGSAGDFLLRDFSAVIDNSDFSGLAKVVFLKRPKITLRLQAGLLDLTTLMDSLDKDLADRTEPATSKTPIFPDTPLPFGALEKVDADIDLKAENIRARNALLKFGHLSVKLDHGELNIDKLEATYKDAKISGNLQIVPGSPSRLATKFLVQHFDLGSLLKETGVSDRVRAIIDVAAHLDGRGDSVHRLVAGLDGSVGGVMGKGYLTQYLNLISLDLSKKVLHFWGRHKDANQIKCAVVQFDIRDGVAASKAFVFNTRAGILTGAGKINLGTEKVDFLLVPTPKRPGLLELSTKLRVSGTISDPKVRPDKLALLAKGARALSALAIGPLGLLAPFVTLGAHDKHPCDIQSIGDLGLEAPGKKKKK